MTSRDPLVLRPGGASVPWPPQDDRLAQDAKRALSSAQDEAARLDHNHIGPVHLLMGLVCEGEGLAARTLAELGVTSEGARAALESTMGRSAEPIAASDITVTPRAQRVIDMAKYGSRRLGHDTTATEHLLLALIDENEHFTRRLLDALGVDQDNVRTRTLAHVRVPPSYRTAEHADLSEGPYERFDEASRQVLAFAREEATRLGHHWIGGEHLLLGLARTAERAASAAALRDVFAQFGLTVERLRAEVEKTQPSRPSQAPIGEMKFTGMTKLIIELAIQEAGPDNVVSPGHILVAVGASQDSIAGYVLARFGATSADVRAAFDRGDTSAT
jgi:ATP-dependent Clp protease ATP-binding subunit ClpA